MGRMENIEPLAGPRHVAIIMDGNGRWATRRGLPRLEGHRKGVEAVRDVVKACPDLGINVITLYAFSTENWKRPVEEVQGLMSLFRRYFRKEAANLVKEGARVVFIGDRAGMDGDIQEMMASLEAQSAHNTKLTICIALNYGGRAEIASAARRLAQKVGEGRIAADQVCEKALASELNTAGLPDPDLVIRTSGEQRLSNFLLWQCAYAEFLFVDDLWPDFTADKLAEALSVFDARERRFGAVAG